MIAKGELIMLWVAMAFTPQLSPESEVVPQGGLDVADVLVDFPQAALNFLAGVLLVSDGVRFHLGFEVFQAVVEGKRVTQKIWGKEIAESETEKQLLLDFILMWVVLTFGML